MSDSPLDPSEVAEVSETAAESPVGGHVDTESIEMAEGPDSGPSGSPWYVRALKNTEPNTPIENVDGFEDIREHWKSYGVRGLEKCSNLDDAMAGVDLAKFVIGAVLSKAEGGSSNSDTSSSSDSDGDDDSISLEGVPTTGDV